MMTYLYTTLVSERMIECAIILGFLELHLSDRCQHRSHRWYTKVRYEFSSANFQQLVGYEPGVVYTSGL